MSEPRPIDELLAVMDRLRRECPWTAEQTHESLRKYVLEEAEEVAEALESGDAAHIRDELGDLLMQVVFHARLGEEGDDPWSFDDVARAITSKLIRRNPHVFAEYGPRAADMTVAEVDEQWQRIKRAEKAGS